MAFMKDDYARTVEINNFGSQALALTAVPDHRLLEIDVLRGLASMWVVLSHYGPHWNEHLAPIFVLIPNSFGIYGVLLFFAISGFVIFMTLDRCRTVTEFAILRFSRLYPTYWTVLLFGTVADIALFGGKLWVGGILTNLTMFQEFLRFPHFDVVFWSLSVELAFYLNAAWLFALRWHHRVCAVIAIWLIGASVWALTQPIIPPSGEPNRGWLALLFAFDFAPYFSVGVLFFDASKHGWSSSRVTLLVLAMVAEFLIRGWGGIMVATGVLALFFSATYGYLRFLILKPTLWLGAISYTLYLVHRNLGYQALDWFHAHNWKAALAIPLTILGALLLATLLTYGVERPCVERGRQLYRRRRMTSST